MNDSALTRHTILLVEDREEDVFFLRRAFSRVGAEVDVRVVSNGVEAQAYISGQRPFSDRSYYPLPGLIVCDFKMPRRGGVDFLKWLRAQKEFESLPFVLLSGSVLPHEKELALELGADLYLRKTADFGKMMEHAQTILRLYLDRAAGRESRARVISSRERLVLVIDDDPKVMRMIGDILEPFGFDIMPASTSAEGLACAQVQRPDVVLCDIVLPDALGFHTARTLNQDPRTKDVPVVLMTGYSYARDLEPNSKWQLMVKPFTASTVVETVMRALPTTKAA